MVWWWCIVEVWWILFSKLTHFGVYLLTILEFLHFKYLIFLFNKFLGTFELSNLYPFWQRTFSVCWLTIDRTEWWMFVGISQPNVLTAFSMVPIKWLGIYIIQITWHGNKLLFNCYRIFYWIYTYHDVSFEGRRPLTPKWGLKWMRSIHVLWSCVRVFWMANAIDFFCAFDVSCSFFKVFQRILLVPKKNLEIKIIEEEILAFKRIKFWNLSYINHSTFIS